MYNLLTISPAKKNDKENLFEIITADEVHYFLQAASPNERIEWIKAIQVASRTGKWGHSCSSPTPLAGSPIWDLSATGTHQQERVWGGKFSSAGSSECILPCATLCLLPLTAHYILSPPFCIPQAAVRHSWATSLLLTLGHLVGNEGAKRGAL